MTQVMVATPSHDGKVRVEYAYAMGESIRLCARAGVSLCPVYFPGESILPWARNELLAIAVASGVDQVIWIDADMAWEPDSIIRLLGHEVDVVGYPCVKRTDDEAYNVKARPDQLVANDRGLMQVLSVGTGFLRMSRSAVKALWDNSRPYNTPNGERRNVFEIGIMQGEPISEDVMTCGKLAALGFPVHIDPSVTCSHVGSKTFTGSFSGFVDRLKAA